MAVYMKDGVRMSVSDKDQEKAFRNAGWKEVSAPSTPKEDKEDVAVDISTVTPDNLDSLEWAQMKSAAKQMGINSQGMKRDELKAAMLEKLAVKEA